jgi:hypothetical protein
MNTDTPSLPALIRYKSGIAFAHLFTDGALIRARIASVAPAPTGDEDTHEPEAAEFLRHEIPPVLDACEILREAVAGIREAVTPRGLRLLAQDNTGNSWKVTHPGRNSASLRVLTDSESGLRVWLTHPGRIAENDAQKKAIEDYHSLTSFPSFWSAWEAALTAETETGTLPL